MPTPKHTAALAAVALCLAWSTIATAQSTRSTLYQGDARVDIQEAKDFEFVLKRGEQLIIEALGVDDEPISTFKVVDLRDGMVVTELSERKTIDSRVTIPKDGPYQLHFFNNSSWIEKIFQIRIDIESPEGAIIASDRFVEWSETRTVTPVKKVSGAHTLNMQSGSMVYAFFEIRVSKEEAGSLFIDVGVLDVAKPWTEQLRSINGITTFRTDPLKSLQDGELSPAKLGGTDSIDWKLFTVDQWNAFAGGATTQSVAGSEGVSAELTTVPVSEGTYVLFVAQDPARSNWDIFVEVWSHKVQTTRALN